MIAATTAMAWAAIAADRSFRHLRAGDQARTRHHSGWAIIFGAVGFFCAIMHWAFE